jgi:hypothetical protein
MKFFQSQSCEMVPKNQVGIMLLRGLAGIGLLAWSFTLMPSLPLLALGVIGVSVWLLKGCPACWGMHMVNAVRDAAKSSKTAVAIVHKEAPSRPKRKYQPRDMSEHLFPPEDVARFREIRRDNFQSDRLQEEKSHVG